MYPGAKGNNSHNCPAEETDTDHKEPAGDHAEAKENVTQSNVESVLGEPAIGGVEGTVILADFLVGLLRVDLVDGLRSDSGGVQKDDVQRSGGARLIRLRLGNLEVPNGGGTSRPNGAQNLVLLTVQVTELGRGRVGSKQKHGFLSSRCQPTGSSRIDPGRGNIH